MDTIKKQFLIIFLYGGLGALAACQSSPPIRQYTLLNSLEHSLYNAKGASDNALKALKADVKKQGNSREGLERIKRSEQLKQRTAALLGEIEKVKDILVKNAGGGLDPKTHMPKQPLNTNKVRQIMKKEAPVLSKRLNAFTLFITVEFKDLTLPRFDNLGDGIDGYTFYETFFKGANLVEALSALTQREAVALRYESEVMKKMGAGDLSADLKFDKLDPIKQFFGEVKVDIEQEKYAKTYSSHFYQPWDRPLSTFSIDVDNASYANVRRFLGYNMRPPVDAVRIEEMINYFDYDYPQPQSINNRKTAPFSINTEYGDCPWNPAHKLLHIGLQGKKLKDEQAVPSNLVFLLDVSGSMDAVDKLPLLKDSFEILLDQLKGAKTTVAMVVYAGAAGLVLPPTPVSQKKKIMEAIKNLDAGGSTSGGEGIALAYKVAQQAFIKGGNNRIILATDGDFNVGPSSDEALLELIREKRKTGVFLTCLGFGTGNLNDSMMEKVSNAGNGNYFYIDQLNEAKKVLAQSLAGTLYTIAKDVKIQVEFNPAFVKSYRLIGYDNRVLKDKDFSNDKVDAGELGAGHTVTALYEIVPQTINEATGTVDIPLKYQKVNQLDSAALSGNELVTVKLRYKQPDGEQSKLLQQIVKNRVQAQTTNRFRFSAAVAAFGMRLRNSPHAQISYDKIHQLARGALGRDQQGHRKEFMGMVYQMISQ
ncbi:MAG TPA: hypothetical protein DCS93_06855 [Microscillaceae bacterium]|nr:hypothetical protein [Microscillaceae bacterium]